MVRKVAPVRDVGVLATSHSGEVVPTTFYSDTGSNRITSATNVSDPEQRTFTMENDGNTILQLEMVVNDISAWAAVHIDVELTVEVDILGQMIPVDDIRLDRPNADGQIKEYGPFPTALFGESVIFKLTDKPSGTNNELIFRGIKR